MNVNIRFLPENVVISVKKGTTLLRAAQKAKVSVRTRCGGRAACLMCKVKVHDKHSCSPIEAKEARKLGSLVEQQYRLACQAKVISSTVFVEIPEDPLKAAIRKQLAAEREELW